MSALVPAARITTGDWRRGAASTDVVQARGSVSPAADVATDRRAAVAPTTAVAPCGWRHVVWLRADPEHVRLSRCPADGHNACKQRRGERQDQEQSH
jgi:hypothetical protein